MTLADKIVVLNAGRIEQVGAPLQLYKDPDNIFVAGFIGSPKMNFLDATVKSVAGGAATVELEDHASEPFAVPGSAGLSEGLPVTVGIRPEHFQARGSAHIETRIDVIEHLGGVSYGYSGAGNDNPLTIALNEDDAATPGQTFKARFDPPQAFLFDRGTGLDDLRYPLWMQETFGLQDRVQRWVAYLMLPIGLALLAFRALQGVAGIVRGERDLIIAGHEAEELVAENKDALKE